MKGCRTELIALAALIICGCAHSPDGPKLDRSPGIDLSPIARRLSVSRCKVSVPLTQDQVLEAARRLGDPQPEDRAEWAYMVKSVQPSDELRQITCLKRGLHGMATGDIFFGLFRSGEVVAEMHNVIIN